MKKLLYIGFLFCLIQAHAQQWPVVSGSFQNRDLTSIFNSFQEQSGVPIYFFAKQTDSLYYTGSFTAENLDSALEKVLDATSLSYFQYKGSIYVASELQIIDHPAIESALFQQTEDTIQTQEVEKGLLFSREYLNQNTTRNDLENFVFEIGSRSKLVKGGTSTVAGYITDNETGEPLTGAVVYTRNPMRATSTDPSGFYSISLPNGRNSLLIQYSGMKTTRREIALFSNGRLDVAMDVDVIALQEVTIESERDANVQNIQMGVEKLDVEATKNVPIVLGERDIIKIATTFAGVQSPGEGASGFNVRGGKSDQNLVLLNDATIFNASHFLGFFSVFNSDAIDNMDIYKSGIPAQFGGRLSSVFDIEAKKANQKKFSGSGGISPITSKLTLEIPIKEEKAGLMVSGRTTYSNWILKRVNNADFRENRVSFSDLIARYDQEINEKNELRITGYYSTDLFRLSSDTLFSFSNFEFVNANASARWIRHFTDNLDGSLSAVYSSYGYDLIYDESPPNAFRQDFGIREATIKADFSYFLDDLNTFKVGLETKRYYINPGTKTSMGEESIVQDEFLNEEIGQESALYLSDEYSLNADLTLYAGLRYSMFQSIGPKSIALYQANAPKNNSTRIGTDEIGKGEVSETYHGPEFRLSGRYVLDESSSIKASYNRTRQYIHTLSNSASLSPTDTWRLSSRYIQPQIADQFALGYYKNLARNTIELSLETYYKDLENLLDFKIGSEFLLNENIETVVLQGPGKSYGIEASLKKSGRLNGWFNYSYARTFIQLESEFREERINNGNFYPASYDMPHTINLVANYKITRRLSASYNLVYNTGKPVTYPVATYGYKGSNAVNYSDRNTFRIPDYFRMDIGISLEAGHRLKKLAGSYFNLSIYNLLGRNNPYSVFFDLVDGEVQGYTLVVFGKPIPTLSYNFRF